MTQVRLEPKITQVVPGRKMTHVALGLVRIASGLLRDCVEIVEDCLGIA